jgi:hypothetical protein
MLGVVVGGGQFVRKEYDQAKATCERLGIDHVAFVVNDMIPLFAGRCHAVTLHFDKLLMWLTERRANGFPPPVEVWCQRDKINRPFVTRVADEFRGSSGMLALYSALAWGCDRILLCGVPMNEALHFKRGKPWAEVKDYQDAWRAHRDELAPRVRSYSGWTMELFGRPTDEFIRGCA